MYQNRRWDGDFLTVRKLLESDRLGRLVKFESHYDRYPPAPRLHAWREDGSPGGGVLFDLGAHLVDQALVLFGVPHSVWASVRVEREGAPDRMTPSTFTCTIPRRSARVSSPAGPVPSGLGVWLRATCLARDPGARFTLNGTLGTFRKFGNRPAGGSSARRRHIFLEAVGPGESGALGHAHTDEGGDPITTRMPTEPGAPPRVTTATCATRCMATRRWRSLRYRPGEPYAFWRWRWRAAERVARLPATGPLSRRGYGR